MLDVLERVFSSGDASPVSSGALGFHADLRVPGNAAPQLRGLAKLPGSVSRQAVIAESGEAAKAEATAKLFQKYVQARQRRINAMVRQHQTAANHQQGVLRANERMTQINSRHGQFLEEHLLNVGSEKAALDGYQQAFQNAQTLVA